jgi:Na+/H+ antiporter NhaD/arsenite permease-like protein
MRRIEWGYLRVLESRQQLSFWYGSGTFSDSASSRAFPRVRQPVFSLTFPGERSMVPVTMPRELASDYVLITATVIFVGTYVLISMRRLGRFSLDRPAVALLGGALMLFAGILTPAQAMGAINLDVILLLVGMMLLVSGLDVCGFFDLVSTRIAGRAKSQLALLAGLMLATAFLSALVLNDAIALLMTPIVVRSARSLKVRPVPYLVALALAANIGSVATEIGNPQNAYIAIVSGIPFLAFTAALLPVMLACLGVSIGLVWLAFRKDLAAPLSRAAALPPIRPQRNGLTVTLGIGLGVVIGFFLSPPTWLPVIAIAGGAFVLFFLPFVSTTNARVLVGKVDWTIVLFFVGLFVLLEGVRVSGLSDGIQTAFTTAFGGQTGGLPWLTGLSALLSNLISNVPAVLLLAQVVQGAGGSHLLWFALASSSTLAGNATILGAACNVIVVQIANREGVEVSMKDFMKAGLPVTAATLILSTILLALLVPA